MGHHVRTRGRRTRRKPADGPTARSVSNGALCFVAPSLQAAESTSGDESTSPVLSASGVGIEMAAMNVVHPVKGGSSTGESKGEESKHPPADDYERQHPPDGRESKLGPSQRSG